MIYTITPGPPKPFKERARKSFQTFLILFSFIVLTGAIKAVFNGKFMPQDSNWVPIGLLMTGTIVLLWGVLILAQVWIIDTVIIDSEKKKIRVLIRKLDKQVDKGEYDIDDKLKITIKTRHAQYGDLHQLVIKYGRKTIWGQSDSRVAGAAGWNHAMFLKVAQTVEKVRNGYTTG